MDTTIGENEKLNIGHIQWLGLENVNGAFVMDGLDGEIQFLKGKFYYCKDNIAIKELKICKDLNDIIIPILNTKIAERNKNIGK